MDSSVLKKNDELILKIDRLGANGEGIAEVEGKVVFVPFACAGEEVLAHIILDKKSYFVAKIIEVLKPSKDRVSPPCPYFKKCGGCDVQHLSYENQLKLKTQIVENSLQKYAKIHEKVNPTIKSENILRYRNKFAFPVVETDSGEIKIGMYKKNSHEVIDISDCLLQSETAKTIIKIFKQYMQENKISGYNENKKSGIIKHIVVREVKEEFILTVVVTDEKFKNFEPLITHLNKYFKSYGIVKNVNKLHNNVIFGNLDINIYGLSELKREEFGIKYSINNRSFMQVNDQIKTAIYKNIIDSLEGQENIIDAYSGAGLLSAILAKHAKNVYGIEIVSEATKDAEKLKKDNGLKNLTNINGDCSKVLPELAKKLKQNFSLVIDPPRKGVSEEVIKAILSSKPKQIIYLSCNPATLARDLNLLKNDYSINFIQPWDMFPQTAEVETLASLKLREK